MSVDLYDKAIIKHFRELFDDSRIHILPVEQAIRFTAQLKKDDVSFPLVSTTRLGYSIRRADINHAGLFTGGFSHRDGMNGNVFAQVMPIRIEYQIDIFTVDRVSCDAIVRELIFEIYKNPTLSINIPYSINSEHNFNIYLEDEIVDNSDTVEHVNRGVLFRNTLTMYTDDANLYYSDVQIQGKVISEVDDINNHVGKEQ